MGSFFLVSLYTFSKFLSSIANPCSAAFARFSKFCKTGLVVPDPALLFVPFSPVSSLVIFSIVVSPSFSISSFIALAVFEVIPGELETILSIV